MYMTNNREHIKEVINMDEKELIKRLNVMDSKIEAFDTSLSVIKDKLDNDIKDKIKNEIINEINTPLEEFGDNINAEIEDIRKNIGKQDIINKRIINIIERLK